MTSKRLTLTFGVLWIAACNASVPASEDASDLSKSATAPVTEKSEFDTLMEELKEEVADESSEESEMLICLLYTSPSPRDATLSRMPSSA